MPAPGVHPFAAITEKGEGERACSRWILDLVPLQFASTGPFAVRHFQPCGWKLEHFPFSSPRLVEAFGDCAKLARGVQNAVQWPRTISSLRWTCGRWTEK